MLGVGFGGWGDLLEVDAVKRSLGQAVGAGLAAQSSRLGWDDAWGIVGQVRACFAVAVCRSNLHPGHQRWVMGVAELGRVGWNMHGSVPPLLLCQH